MKVEINLINENQPAHFRQKVMADI